MRGPSFEDRHPILTVLILPWLIVVVPILVAVPFVLMAAVIFGFLLLGDGLGLWAFDSGLGAENGDLGGAG